MQSLYTDNYTSGGRTAPPPPSYSYAQDHADIWYPENDLTTMILPMPSPSAPIHETFMPNDPEVYIQPPPSPSLPQSLTPDRSWPDISTLSLSDIQIYIDAFMRYSAHTRAAYTSAISDLRLSTSLFLFQPTPLTTSVTTAYTSSFTSALSSTHALFPAQEAYRAALEAFARFVRELVDLLPKASPVKKRLGSVFEQGFKEMMEKEEEVRAGLRGLAEPTMKGGVKIGVGVYIICVGERERNWVAWERSLGAWAGEAMKALG
ncbi:hypothetical protein FB567DRAFT_631822 [Paraphoma chrysanthemicola]|uniref:Uncharacterized protein n=1 Tax=Paraphoma chrysanthemicola TaxID=798071 RepID=A0A8K0QYG6_9PLEO|nr:hypothetical protein FB567DRAFT_631822 [Paraphoma chrysanthemicola]